MVDAETVGSCHQRRIKVWRNSASRLDLERRALCMSDTGISSSVLLLPFSLLFPQYIERVSEPILDVTSPTHLPTNHEKEEEEEGDEAEEVTYAHWVFLHGGDGVVLCTTSGRFVTSLTMWPRNRTFRMVTTSVPCETRSAIRRLSLLLRTRLR